jgi:predicted aminopeptidase
VSSQFEQPVAASRRSLTTYTPGPLRPAPEPPRPRRGRGLRRVVRWTALTLLLAIGVFAVTPLGRYLLRAAWAEAGILMLRRPIVDVVRDPATPPDVRDKLRLVLQARAFAEDSLRLRTRESFTTFSALERDTLVLVLSGAYKDRLEAKTWWFPIVGRVPYKGYFDFARARHAAEELERGGFDVHLRRASAFSTLGWFNDPLLSTTLQADSIDLVDTVIHELTHNTFYESGEAAFNESFANFVGARGAERFFLARGDSASAARVVARWSDQKVLGVFWMHLAQSLDSAFKAHPNGIADRLRARDTIYRAARRELVFGLGPKLHTIGPRALERMPLDNATLMARRVYASDLELFDRVYEREERDLDRAVDRILALARDSDAPFVALREWLEPPLAAWEGVVPDSAAAVTPAP